MGGAGDGSVSLGVCVCVCVIFFFGEGCFWEEGKCFIGAGRCVFLKCFLEEVYFGRCSQEVLFLGVWRVFLERGYFF